jgi:uncharacterized protein
MPKRTLSAGTPPVEAARPPAPGRYAVVHADERRFVYVPQIQELFEAPDDVVGALEQADIPAPRVVDLRQADHLDFDERSGLATLDAAREAVARLAHREGGRSLPLDARDDRRPGLQDLVVHVAQVCNLACGYCYAEDLNKAKATMPLDVAESVVQRAMKLAPAGLHSVKFLGGEPTLAWDVARYLMTRFEEEASARALKTPIFVTVTNGTRMTEAICDDMIRHRMYVLVSLDGEADVHDRNRPFIGGRGSHTKVVGSLRRMIEAGLRPAVEAVYTSAHLDAGVTIRDLVDYYYDLGIREAQITIALGVWHRLDTGSAIEQVRADFVDAARWSVRSFAGHDPFLLRGIQFVLTGFATKTQRTHVCGAGRTFMAVNHDGEAFPCYLLQSPSTSYGFVDSRWSAERYAEVGTRFDKNGKHHHPVCRECWANEICQSCLGSTYLIERDIAKPPAWFCGLQKALISAVLAEIGVMRTSPAWPTFMANLTSATSRPAA